MNGGSASSGNFLYIGDLGTLTGTSVSSGEYKTLNATSGFQILGVGGSGNTVINDTYLTNGFATQILAGKDSGSLNVTNIGRTYTLDIVSGNSSSSLPTNFTLSSAPLTTTALTVNLIPSFFSPTLNNGLTEGTLTTTSGTGMGTITKVALVSNSATSANTINTYHGADGQTVTISGNNALTINSFTPNAKTVDTINASGFAQALTLGTIGGFNAVATGAGDTGKGDVITLGSGTSYLAVSSVVKGDNITLISGHTSVDIIDTTLIASAITKTAYANTAAQTTDITKITNFNTNSDILKVGIAGGSTAPHNGIASDLTNTAGDVWTVTNGFVTGTNKGVNLTGSKGLTAFLADVAASKTFAANDVLAYNDGTNTYIAVGDHSNTVRGEHIIELAGVIGAKALGSAGGATSIDIAPIPLSQTFTLNGVGSGRNPTFYDVSNPLVTSESIISSGVDSRNDVSLTNTGKGVTSLTISGAAYFVAHVDSAFASQLNSINAGTESGGLFIGLVNGNGSIPLKSSFTFTGGFGQSMLSINRADLDALSSGSQLNGGTSFGNTLLIQGLGTLTGNSASTGEYKTLNAVQGFQNLSILGGSNTVINDAYLTNGFASHIFFEQNGGSLTVINVGSSYQLNIDNWDTNIPSHSLTISSAPSTTTALTVNLIPTSFDSMSHNGLTEGILTTTSGTGMGTITQVALESEYGTSANTINTYNGADGQTVTIYGSNALTINSFTPNAKTGDTINAYGFTQALTLGSVGGTYAVATGAGDTGKGDVITLGSVTSYLAVSSAVQGDIVTLLASHTAADTIDTTLIASHVAGVGGLYVSAAAQKADITQITNFHTNSDILKVGIAGVTAPHIGTSSDITGWTVSDGFATKTGSTYSSFLASVAASTTFKANDVLAYNDGTNTYIAVGDHAAGIALGEHIIELVGVHTATALGGAGGATTIHMF